MGSPDPLKDLRSYIEWLESRGSLARINIEASPILEIPALLRRVMYSGGPAILFENVKGYPDWRVAGNLFPSLETFRDALGVERLEEIGLRLIRSALQPPPMGFREKLKALREASGMARMLPGETGRAPFTSHTITSGGAPLDLIPAFKTWPGDASRYLTFPLVVTRDPDTGSYNIGVYRVMLVDGETAVVHWQIHKRGAEDYEKYGEGREIPIALVVGSDPATLFTGVAPVPPPLDKYFFAGIVRGRGLQLYRLDNGLHVPANAEVVIEGYIVPGETSREGPFGDHWGFYDSPIEEYPVVHVTRMHYRDDPIYYGSVVGLPPLEDAVIGKAVERVFLPLMRMIFPEIVDVNFPVHGVFQGAMIVSIRKRYPGHGKKVISGLWGVGQTSLTKMVIVVDESVDPHNMCQVLWAVTSYVDPQRDVIVLDGAHTDMLDPASRAPGYGGKLGIDATRKLPEESGGRRPPQLVSETGELREWADRVYEELFGSKPHGPFERCTRDG
ncbi:MAG: UbiD family decarboxylase [Desulfurococcales archaeon]|nr:UbiD family decarboxylase [Desulfurococcales archaeon]